MEAQMVPSNETMEVIQSLNIDDSTRDDLIELYCINEELGKLIIKLIHYMEGRMTDEDRYPITDILITYGDTVDSSALKYIAKTAALRYSAEMTIGGMMFPQNVIVIEMESVFFKSYFIGCLQDNGKVMLMVEESKIFSIS